MLFCFLALGSNLGDRLAQLQAAVDRLATHPDLSIQAIAPIYETAPIGYTEQPAFYNTVLQARTRLAPEALLALCLQTEEALGRERTTAKSDGGPRLIDIDVLDYNGQVLELAPTLQLPHPRLHLRAFVLLPLADIAPDWRHPVYQATAAQLYQQYASDQHLVKTPHQLSYPPGDGATPAEIGNLG